MGNFVDYTQTEACGSDSWNLVHKDCLLCSHTQEALRDQSESVLLLYTCLSTAKGKQSLSWIEDLKFFPTCVTASPSSNK